MGSVIKVSFSMEWQLPVFVERDGLEDKAIYGPAEALKFLQEKFEHRSGGLYRLAVESCRAALTHKQDPDKSRAYFFAACGKLRMKSK